MKSLVWPLSTQSQRSLTETASHAVFKRRLLPATGGAHAASLNNIGEFLHRSVHPQRLSTEEIMQLYSPTSRWSSSLFLTLALWGVSWTLLAHNLYGLPVGTMLNCGPDLQTAAGGVCRQPEGLAIDPDGNLYAASNSDRATTFGYVCVIDKHGSLVDIITVPAGPGAAAVGLLGELWENGSLYVLDQADNIQPHG